MGASITDSPRSGIQRSTTICAHVHYSTLSPALNLPRVYSPAQLVGRKSLPFCAPAHFAETNLGMPRPSESKKGSWIPSSAGPSERSGGGNDARPPGPAAAAADAATARSAEAAGAMLRFLRADSAKRAVARSGELSRPLSAATASCRHKRL